MPLSTLFLDSITSSLSHNKITSTNLNAEKSGSSSESFFVTYNERLQPSTASVSSKSSHDFLNNASNHVNSSTHIRSSNSNTNMMTLFLAADHTSSHVNSSTHISRNSGSSVTSSFLDNISSMHTRPSSKIQQKQGGVTQTYNITTSIKRRHSSNSNLKGRPTSFEFVSEPKFICASNLLSFGYDRTSGSAKKIFKNAKHYQPWPKEGDADGIYKNATTDSKDWYQVGCPFVGSSMKGASQLKTKFAQTQGFSVCSATADSLPGADDCNACFGWTKLGKDRTICADMEDPSTGTAEQQTVPAAGEPAAAGGPDESIKQPSKPLTDAQKAARKNRCISISEHDWNSLPILSTNALKGKEDRFGRVLGTVQYKEFKINPDGSGGSPEKAGSSSSGGGERTVRIIVSHEFPVFAPMKDRGMPLVAPQLSVDLTNLDWLRQYNKQKAEIDERLTTQQKFMERLGDKLRFQHCDFKSQLYNRIDRIAADFLNCRNIQETFLTVAPGEIIDGKRVGQKYSLNNLIKCGNIQLQDIKELKEKVETMCEPRDDIPPGQEGGAETAPAEEPEGGPEQPVAEVPSGTATEAGGGEESKPEGATTATPQPDEEPEKPGEEEQA